MPELPEVETIRRGLHRRLRGARAIAVEVREPRLRRAIDVERLRELVGRRVSAVERRAKYLLVRLEGGLVWLVHLGMSGRLLVLPAAAPRGDHEHVRVTFDGGFAVAYRDPRRFGLMKLGREEDLVELSGLGPEPLDGGLAGEWLGRKLRATRREVKAVLLDQRVVAGIGNIYASEILFRAGVRPTRRSYRLTRVEVARIIDATREVLDLAIASRGTSFSDYFDVAGERGSFQTRLAVFDRAGQDCVRCRAAIKRRVHGGRSSFYCPRCQT
ncbi:MAG: formamidopyrimidine-DNA glycosylase [Candidatus Binatota bacterium]|nr:formamidopyrimidine-DNA glycosylase [Candidatus Binatota bacterium]